jgi:hypothetical protein
VRVLIGGKTISETVRVSVTPERAFQAFADLQSWWPREYTWSRDVLEKIALEPREGGRLYEIGPHGFHCDFGRVLAWEPRRARLRAGLALHPRALRGAARLASRSSRPGTSSGRWRSAALRRSIARSGIVT